MEFPKEAFETVIRYLEYRRRLLAHGQSTPENTRTIGYLDAIMRDEMADPKRMKYPQLQVVNAQRGRL